MGRIFTLIFWILLVLSGLPCSADPAGSPTANPPADPPTGYTIRFNVYPPTAQVHSTLQYIGPVSKPVTFETLPVAVELRATDYHSLPDITLQTTDFPGKPPYYYPKVGAIELKPLTFQVWLRDLFKYRFERVAATLAGTLALVVLAVYAVRRRRQEKLIDERSGGADRSMIFANVGDYHITDLIGKGGMSQVYLGTSRRKGNTGPAVAIKVLSKELRDQDSFVERFEREITVTQELSHPNIVAVLSWGFYRDSIYLVMEHVQGRELRALMPELKADRRRALDVLSTLMMAVEYAHSRGIAHRDLKPENIMMTDKGQLKIMDFGLGRAIDSKTLTRTGISMGSPRYIAPEAIDAKHVDERADQYSIGVMAYEMLTGQLPFQDDDILKLLYSHAHLEPEPPSSVSDLPVEVDAAILRMMKKQPRERFPSVEDARRALLKACGEHL